MSKVERDNLLHVLSARRQTGWKVFKQIFDKFVAIHESSSDAADGYSNERTVPIMRREVIRTLDSLGHCEYFNREGKLSIGPPMFARLPGVGLPSAVLVGRRSTRTIPEVRHALKSIDANGSLEVAPNPYLIPLLPDRVRITVAEESILAALAKELDLPFSRVPSALQLINFVTGLENYVHNLDWHDAPELGWVRKDFNPHMLRYVSEYSTDDSLRLSRYIDPVQGVLRYYLWMGNRRALVDPDWGRFALMQNQDVNSLVYDPNRLSLAVPSPTPLPRLIGRSLTLCSGLAPRKIAKLFRKPRHSKFAVYNDVPFAIAKTASIKLGQKLVTERIPICR